MAARWPYSRRRPKSATSSHRRRCRRSSPSFATKPKPWVSSLLSERTPLSRAVEELRRRDELNLVRARDRKRRGNKCCHHQDRGRRVRVLAMRKHRHDGTEDENGGQCDSPSAQAWLREHQSGRDVEEARRQPQVARVVPAPVRLAQEARTCELHDSDDAEEYCERQGHQGRDAVHRSTPTLRPPIKGWVGSRGGWDPTRMLGRSGDDPPA